MKTFLALVLLFTFFITTSAQQCYTPNMNAGKAEYENENYEKAISYFETAKSCPDRPGVSDANTWIGKCNKKIKELFSTNIEKNMIFIQGGTFAMGCTSEQGSDCYDDESPTHSVSISDFHISKYEVTFEEYDVYCEATGAKKPDDEGWGRGERPVINVSWYDAKDFCEWLSKESGKTYRLPTEAEWEYAARGDNSSRAYKYAGSNNIKSIAWYYNNSGNKTHPVGQKSANELGLYDMSGNVCEWCSDWYGNYSSNSQTNPRGVSSEGRRVRRGGSWFSNAKDCRPSFRNSRSPSYSVDSIGFRLVLAPQ